MVVSLFIYIFYRTEKTLVNQIIIQFISLKNYNNLKLLTTSSLPLNKYIIYSLPEGLWVFCITLTSKEFYMEFFKQHINCVFIPLVFAIGLEFLQLFHITKGHFDIYDIAATLIFWLIATRIIDTKYNFKNILSAPSYNGLFCLISYCIVYLAHVMG
ncbi:hypothetical protein EZ449_16585 [Pedobacter frigidisoli]|uniref:Uncharacterized protein n=1 Tax=Pedobacter frigidisoli TaxID=2530455 RepID=A0A4R0NY43_9SPHI|nr:hypothetical protein EZ449_16585 [Pedobacter frigidisoli]